jgi:hypothetical protein
MAKIEERGKKEGENDANKPNIGVGSGTRMH